jgi:hypothetical protein
MICNGYTRIWDLAQGELVKLDGARGTTLRVTRGALWLTFEGDARDVVLRAGDTFTIDRAGLTLIEAQRQSTVCVMAHHVAETHVPATRAGIAQRLAAWLGSIGAADRDRRWAPYY